MSIILYKEVNYVRKNVQNNVSNGVKVLIVDDEIGIIDSLSIFLRKFGYDFVRCY